MAHESPQKVSQQFIWWLSKHPWRSFCKKDQDLIKRWHVKRKPNATEISNGKDFMLQSPNWQQPQSEWLTNLSRSISAVYLMVVKASSASFSPEHCPNARENSLAYHIAGISVPPCAWVCLLVFISIWIEILQLWYTCIYLQYVGLDMKHADLMPSKRCGDSNFLKKKSSFCPCLFTLTWKRQVQPSKCQGFSAPKNVSSFIVQFRSNSPKSNIKKWHKTFGTARKNCWCICWALVAIMEIYCLRYVVECSKLQSPKSLRLAAKALGSELEWCQFLC